MSSAARYAILEHVGLESFGAILYVLAFQTPLDGGKKVRLAHKMTSCIHARERGLPKDWSFDERTRTCQQQGKWRRILSC